MEKANPARAGTAEIKNLNSFRFVEQAILYEIDRQIGILEAGGNITQETRLFDPVKNETRSMRTKEEANDYRYFPDPDLLPVETSQSDIEALRAELPELPDARRKRFIDDYELSEYDANNLTSSREQADYFEQTVVAAGGEIKLSVNWIMGDLSAALNRDNLDIGSSPVSAVMLGGMIQRITDNTISGKIAKQVFEEMWVGNGTADDIIANQGLKQVTDTGLIETLVNEVIDDNPDQVEQFLAGKDKVLGFFVGQVMKKSQGKANPQQVNDLLREKLKR